MKFCRGIGNLIRQSILQKPAQAPLHFYCTSGGNAGLAAVVAAKKYGYPSTVVVPMTTRAAMIQKLRAAGATNVMQVGDSWMEADAWLKENLLANDSNGVYVPPFDHPWIFEGATSLVEELNAQLHGDEPDAIVCSVGGGGLFCGIMQGIDEYKWTKTQVLAIETIGADSLNNSLRKGVNTTMTKISSIATSLGAKRVANATFEYAQRKHVTSAVVSDAHAAMGCWRFADDERILIEPACGASVATCYNGMLKKLLPELTPESKVAIIVCGGSAISTELLEEFRTTYAEAEIEATNDPAIPSTLTAPIPA
jgi:L-serine/L-threonine ammonia-lyase